MTHVHSELVMFRLSSVFPSSLRIVTVRWQRVLEDSRVLRSFLSKVILILTDGLNKEMCIAAYLFAKQVIYLGRKSGYLHLALYLKQCNTCLMTAYGGVNRPKGSLSVPVSLTRSGYPRIIPSFHRKMILRKDDRADVLVRLYCSFFSLA